MRYFAYGVLILIGVTKSFAIDASAICEARSGESRAALLELYTSEGCNSCPPADRWLGALTTRGFSNKEVVPLAFHVDYWNYLGWADPFAQRLYTERQEDFARRTGAATVYTPEFVLNGREYRGWRRGDLASELRRESESPRADISLRLYMRAKDVRISAEADVRNGASGDLYIAIYENNLRSSVKAGENRGRTLEHAYVVRRLIGPRPIPPSGRISAREDVALAADWKVSDLGVAAFVQETRGTAVLQALALDFCAVQKKRPVAR